MAPLGSERERERCARDAIEREMTEREKLPSRVEIASNPSPSPLSLFFPPWGLSLLHKTGVGEAIGEFGEERARMREAEV